LFVWFWSQSILIYPINSSKIATNNCQWYIVFYRALIIPHCIMILDRNFPIQKHGTSVSIFSLIVVRISGLLFSCAYKTHMCGIKPSEGMKLFRFRQNIVVQICCPSHARKLFFTDLMMERQRERLTESKVSVDFVKLCHSVCVCSLDHSSSYCWWNREKKNWSWNVVWVLNLEQVFFWC